MSPTGLVGLLIGLAGVAAIVGGDFATTDPTALIQIVIVVIGYAVGPAILGVLVLHETLTPAMALGFALVIAGSTLATRRSRPDAEPAVAPA